MHIDHELAILRQMTHELHDYLLSEVEFWPLGGSSSYPRLSLGAYWLTRTRLSAFAEPRAAALNAAADAELTHWAATAERKAGAELATRVSLWEKYLADRRGRYATEVAQRVMAALLLQQYPGLAAAPAAQRLTALDQGLRALPPAAFVWEAELEPAFPADAFWCLRRAG